ncbi:hypothetical protein FDB64_02530 [Clostridium botulinum]|nr:hypothetical protein [Clostridium botulinum]NFM02669.1 hypothetical protein [Clostridium botulinum]
MSMYRNIINKKVDKYCDENNIKNIDLGFLKYVNELFYNGDYNETEESIVDGQSDKQVDLIQIEEDETTTIRIIQVKNKNGFESNVVILLRNGLDWIFNREEREVLDLPNNAFKNRILEIRDVLANKKSLKNIYIDVCYVTKGNKDDIRENDEIIAEINRLTTQYRNLFENFRFELYGAKELLEYIELLNDKTINTELELVYDINTSSLIENRNENIKSLVCNIKASELVKIFLEQKSEYLFEQNVRKYLEDRSKVNKNIIETASNEDSEYFWALNNGVTIICDEYDLKIVGGKANVSMENLQIINGCQTTMALFQASKNKTLKADTSLLLRIHQTSDEKVIEKIILATNNQNPINPKDLVSNSISQIELQRYFYEIYGVYYQRKRNDFRDINGKLVNKKDIISNDKVGQAALSCIKCMAHIALASKGRIYSTDADVFDKNKEHIVLAFFIHEKVLECAKHNFIKSNSELTSLIKFGRFHLTYLLYEIYVNDIGIEFNKKIRHNDIDLSDEIYLATYILNKELPIERKNNLLSYFKSKDSLNKINEILEVIRRIRMPIKNIITNYEIEDFNIVEFCEEDMKFEIGRIEIKFNINGSISIYQRFIYDFEEYEGQYDELKEEENNFINVLSVELNIKPELIDDSCSGCQATDILVGYFEIRFDEGFIKRFIELI